MDRDLHVVFKVEDRSYFAIIKKGIHNIAARAGFSDNKLAEIDIVVAELVTNLVKHAGGGLVFVKATVDKGWKELELISIDNGPGITDVPRMLQDGVSTKNTLGQGLGAIKRLSDQFQIYSGKELGTISLIRITENKPESMREGIPAEIRSIVIPKTGETACGDGFFTSTIGNKIRLFLGDGLGHGPEAENAVTKAGSAFLNSTETDPVALIRDIDKAVRKTRGLVGTIAVFNTTEKNWSICGVGNIMSRLTGQYQSRNHTPHNGIIGLNVPNTLTAQRYDHEPGQILIMCSDGTKSRWDLSKLPSVLRYDYSIVAASIVKDFNRGNDDTSVVVCKINY
ncbi:MAG: ATP-binding protein [Flavitalea sp.]